jgi:transcriptional regulator with XRE-family HTH domain
VVSSADADALDVADEVTASAIARALGMELRQAREAHEWSRAEFVKLLPSGIGDRTLLAYEHGLRQLTIIRLLELSEALDVPAADILSQALQRARLYLHNLVLRVDLRQLLADTNIHYRPMFQWARNRLNDTENGVIELTPSGLRELAAFIGRTPTELARYLAKFMPTDPEPEEDTETPSQKPTPHEQPQAG